MSALLRVIGHIILLLSAILLLPATSLAANSDAANASQLTREDLDAWLDGLLPYAIRNGKIAGGVVMVVKDGQILTVKGYGYADVARRRPIDPETTIMRPGSISKLFVWTAVMQQVERGRLDLDADVNRYLDFHIPAYAGRPITLRNIVTHTTGFEEGFKDLMGRQSSMSLETYLKTHIPDRVDPPGRVPAYSNYASALAAYVVERVSGEKFDAYAARHILQPLGMRQSTFAQVLPANRRALLSEGYKTNDQPKGYYEFVTPYPAGGLNTTAPDMARFMIAQLQKGELDGARILSDSAAKALHAPQARTFPALNAMAVGFYETSRNGHRSIAHNGGTQFFHSDLHLLVDDGVGIFISLNSSGDDAAATGIHNALFDGFMDRYFPASPSLPAESRFAADRRHGEATAGYWESSRRSTGNLFALGSLLAPIVVTANPDGSLSLPFPGRGVVRWREIAPFVWKADDKGDRMQVLLRDGSPAMIGFDAAPPAAFLPIPWWRSPGWLVPALGIALLMLLAEGLSLPVGAIARRAFNVTVAPVPWRRSFRLACVAVVVLALAYPALIASLSNDADALSGRSDPVLLTLEVLTLGVFIIATLLAGAQWRRSPSRWRRVWIATLIASLGVLWWTGLAFRLFNFNLNY